MSVVLTRPLGTNTDPPFIIDQFVVDSTIINNGFITLTKTPTGNSDFVYHNGQLLQNSPGSDYTMTNNIVTFETGFGLSLGDSIRVTYKG